MSVKTYLFIWKPTRVTHWTVMRWQAADAAAAEEMGKQSLRNHEAAKPKSSPFSFFPIEFYVAEPASRQVIEWQP